MKLILQAARQALNWRLMLVWTLALLLPAAIMSMPFHTSFAEAFNHNVHAAELAKHLDLIAVTDLQSLIRQGGRADQASLIAVILLAALSPLLTGAAITAARAESPLAAGALLAGALQEYPRMLRMFLWSIIPLGAAFMLVALISAAAFGIASDSTSEAAADALALAGVLGSAIVIVLLHAYVESTRARLALDRRQRSVLRALWLEWRRPFKQQLRINGAWLATTLTGLSVVALCALLRMQLPYWGWPSEMLSALLALLSVLALAWARCARLFAIMQLHRNTV